MGSFISTFSMGCIYWFPLAQETYIPPSCWESFIFSPLSDGMSIKGNFLPLWLHVILILAWASLLIIMSQLQYLKPFLNVSCWQCAVQLHTVLLEWRVRWSAQSKVEGNSAP